MKLDEAAAILGVPADADLELLKQTYRKMVMAWHPDKVRTLYCYCFVIITCSSVVMGV